MARISDYRKGYEDMKREINLSHDQSLPEQFVKGLFSIPGDGVRHMLRGRDEEQGRYDALHRLEFDPFRAEREEREEQRHQKLQEQQQETEKQVEKTMLGKGVSLSTDTDDAAGILMAWAFKFLVGVLVFVFALIAVLTSMPFWLGGLVLGWLAGFLSGVIRGYCIDEQSIRAAELHEIGNRRKIVVDEAFLSGAAKGLDRVWPAILSLLWCTLLAWPLFSITDRVPWAGMASLGASAAGLVLAIMYTPSGFRRGLGWCVRSAQGVSGGSDAIWGTVGCILGCLTLLLMAAIGMGLPVSLVRDFGPNP